MPTRALHEHVAELVAYIETAGYAVHAGTALRLRVGPQVCGMALWLRVGSRACGTALWLRVGSRASRRRQCTRAGRYAGVMRLHMRT